MIEITNDEIWSRQYIKKEEMPKRTKIKFLDIAFSIFGICAVVNMILIYSFFKIIGFI